MADLKSQKILASRILKCGVTRIWMDPARSADIAEAITAGDIRKLVNDGVIKAFPKMGVSNFRKNKIARQKKKGHRKGTGSRKGALGTRLHKKRTWISRIRAMRKLLLELRSTEKIDNKVYRDLYIKAKSGFFRSRSHIMIYIDRNNLLKKEEKKEVGKK
ncbi:MAG: 50S ribosomal protein L19e [Candidatus Aenigmarchaeota archaeon]|nr:50S ribosomal protein L19e [Candidatus Aenigmarchaeota archaeon]